MSHFFGRRFTSGSGSGDGYNDHGLLIGLGDDDHLQYLITTAIRTEVTPASGINKTGSGAGDVFTLENAGTGAALFIRQTGNTTTSDAALDIDNSGNVGRGLSVFSNTPDPDLPLVQFSALDESFDEPVLSITHANPCGLALQVLGDAYFACQIEVASGIVFGVHETSPIALGETGIYIKGDPGSPGEFYFVDKNGNERTFTSITDLSALLIEGCGIDIIDSGDGYKIFSVDVESLAGPGLDVIIGDDGCLKLTSTGGSAANLVEGCNIDLVSVDGYTSISVDVSSLAGNGLISVIGDDGCERLEIDFDGYLLQSIHIRKYGYEADDHPFNSVFSLDGYAYEVGRDRLIVTLDGLMQFPPQDYVESSTTTIEFVEPVDDNEVIDILLLPGSLGNIIVDGSSDTVTVTLQNAYDDSSPGAKNIIVDDGQITFTQTEASGSVLRLISNSSVTTGLTVDQNGGGEAARLKSVIDSKATLLIQKDTTARNTETDTVIIERTTSHISGGLTGIGSGILTRLEDTGSNIFDASRITTGTESASDSSEKTFLAIELSDDGIMTEHLRLTSVGHLGVKTTTPNDFTVQVAGDVGPDADNIYDLGSSSKRWQDGYFANDVYVSSKVRAGANQVYAPLNVPVLEADPTVFDDGDIWVTDIAGVKQIKVRIGGITYSVTLT